MLLLFLLLLLLSLLYFEFLLKIFCICMLFITKLHWLRAKLPPANAFFRNCRWGKKNLTKRNVHRRSVLSLFVLAPFSASPLAVPCPLSLSLSLSYHPSLTPSAIIIVLSVLPPSQIAQQQHEYCKGGRTIEPTSTRREIYVHKVLKLTNNIFKPSIPLSLN